MPILKIGLYHTYLPAFLFVRLILSSVNLSFREKENHMFRQKGQVPFPIFFLQRVFFFFVFFFGPGFKNFRPVQHGLIEYFLQFSGGKFECIYLCMYSTKRPINLQAGVARHHTRSQAILIPPISFNF